MGLVRPVSAEIGRNCLQGMARCDRRTKNLVKRLRPGDIAVIDHADLDALAAQSLADAQVAAVVNAQPFISGKYPNRGPAVLAAAQIPLYQLSDPAQFGRFRDGAASERLTTPGGCLSRKSALDTLTRWDEAPHYAGNRAGKSQSGRGTGKVRPQHAAISGRRQRPAAGPDQCSGPAKGQNGGPSCSGRRARRRLQRRPGSDAAVFGRGAARLDCRGRRRGCAAGAGAAARHYSGRHGQRFR